MYERTYHKRVLKTEDTKPKKKKKSVRLNWKVVTLVSVVVVLFVGFVIATRASRFQVRNVVVEGTNVADPQEVSAFVVNALAGKSLYIFPRTSILIVPIGTLEKRIRESFPRFETVSISRKNFSTLEVTVTEYGGTYLWCTNETTCFFMDKNGVVFADAPYFSGSAYPKVFVGEKGELPFTPISAQQLSTMELLLERLKAISIEPTEFRFSTPHELDITFVHYGRDSKLMFDPTLSIEDALSALFTGIRTQPLLGKYHDESKVLEYIDLRFQNKVVYKFQ